jgi:hypothetical protein
MKDDVVDSDVVSCDAVESLLAAHLNGPLSLLAHTPASDQHDSRGQQSIDISTKVCESYPSRRSRRSV